jgi:hypothetical protein
VGGGGTFASGSSRTVTATANSGFTFANWTENGGVVGAAARAFSDQIALYPAAAK